MRHFRLSLAVTALCLALAYYWNGASGAFIAMILGILEVSLSFDNAVVNACVLKRMNPRWQFYFLTWGILIAVFGMRLLFPIFIVATATGIDWLGVANMALHDPLTYAHHLEESHVEIASFGGMFLLMVFLGFIFDEGRELHWLGKIEEKLGSFGKLESIELMIALAILLAIQNRLLQEIRLDVMIAGITGIMLFVVVDSMTALFENEEEGEQVITSLKKAGLMSFVYLEILDASFSFDGVIGAFAITQDVIIIMLGLAIGAMFVRSLTVYLVRQGTLDEYVFLEHGAHYAIGVLAGIMLISIDHQIPEVVTGLTGALLIALSLISSVRYKRNVQL